MLERRNISGVYELCPCCCAHNPFMFEVFCSCGIRGSFRDRQFSSSPGLEGFTVGPFSPLRESSSFKPPQWWDNRLRKRISPSHLNIQHRRTSCCNRLWVDSRIGIQEDARLQGGPGAPQGPAGSPKPANVLQSLCNQGQLDKAMDVLLRMDEHGSAPSVGMYSTLLKACSKRKALVQAKRVHDHLARHGLESSRFLGENVVITLVKCGGLEDAVKLFQRLTHRSVFSWTALISGYTMAGQGKEALRTYQCMREEGLEPDKYTFVSLLGACSSLLDLEEGKRVHAEAVKYRHQFDLFVGTCLIDMYGKCGSIEDAKKVFDGLSRRNVVSWTSMIAAYIQQGQPNTALQLYKQMGDEGVSPNQRTFVFVLQACAMLAEKEGVDAQHSKGKSPLEKGRAIHVEAQREGYDSDVFVGNTLISMYGKCGSVVDAQKVFQQMPQRNVVSWNAMIAALAQQGQAEEALQLYGKMWETNVSPNDRTFVSALQACGMLAEQEECAVVDGQSTKPEVLDKGKAIHVDAKRKGYDSDVFVGNTLVSMYGKCGSIVDAEDVFNRLSRRDVVSWNAMIAAYVEQGQPSRALQLYDQMLEEGVSRDDATFVSALQACGMLAEKTGTVTLAGQSVALKPLERGREIHVEAKRKGYDLGHFVANTIISMYGKCGSVTDSKDVFDGLLHRGVVSWNVMLAAYLQQGQVEKALQLYERMGSENVAPDVRTFVILLQACDILADQEEAVVVDGRRTKVKSLDRGRAIHADAEREGLGSDVYVGSALISMYGTCGRISDAQTVFDNLSRCDVVAWTALLAVYVEEGQPVKVFQLYEQMQSVGMGPNSRTFVSVIQACGMLAEKEEETLVHGEPTKVKSLEQGQAIHADVRSKGYDSDVFVRCTLVSMYGKCGSIMHAQDVFDQQFQRSVALWNAMLAAYAERSQGHKALQLYEQMKMEGVSLDDRSFVSVLQACAMLAEEEEDTITDGQCTKVNCLEKGRLIHADARAKGFDSDVFVANTLVSMYGKCGSISDAQQVFDSLLHRNVVTWNAMLAGYVHQGQAEKALQLYRQMLEEGLSLNEITLVCTLQACSNTGGLEICRQIHHTFASTMINLTPLLANALVSAYGRCASMPDAQTLFEALPLPDEVSWNALIAGYARQGDYAATVQCYEQMLVAGIKPNGATFVSLLSTCSHAGLVEEGVAFFESMSRDQGIAPDIGHYVTMVDLLGRAGHLTEVEHLLSTMPMEANLSVWLCLLSACRKHAKVLLGKQAFDSAVRLQPKHPSAYVLMLNIYADAGRWDEAKALDESRQVAGAWKKPGQSWIEHGQEVHSFVARDSIPQEEGGVHDLLRKVSLVVKEQGITCR